MSDIQSTPVQNLACYVSDEDSKSVLQAIPFKDHGIHAEIYDGGIAYALEHLKGQRSPDIILVDVSKSSMALSDMAHLAEICEPRVEVIVIGDKNDIGLFRNLIKMGIRDYYVKPLLDSILVKGIEEIVQHEETTTSTGLKSGKIVSVMGSRGGVGTSSIVTNLGVLLSTQYDKRVCMMDMDMHSGTFPQYLNIETSDGFSQLFESPDRIDKVLVERYMTFYNERLGVLCSELSLTDKPDIKPDAIEALFNFISPQFHYTLIDLPRHFSTQLVSNVLSRSTQLIVICDYSITSLKDCCRIMQLAKSFPNLSHGILFVANQTNLYKDGYIDRSTFEETLQRQISLEIQFDHTYPMTALTDGDPVVLNAKGAMAEGIHELCKTILGIQTKASLSNNSAGGILKKLMGRN
ncbi:MAG: AAA family ATPase [Candidatus Paracaedibacteraceae bacterium]|nr:AAA family ATPase [Candidatus Paracaedibacteraceae bacterium]